MTVDEIFSQVAGHMTEGLMVQAQMAHYYDFLGLKGYSQCHLYHFIDENSNYIKLTHYFIKHYNKIPVETTFSNPGIVPSDWYSYTRQNVNDSVRKTSVEAGFKKWVDWEKKTKQMYQQYYNELVALGEYAAAEELKKYVVDVSEELADAEQKELTLKADNYNMSDIITEQYYLYDKYKEKMKEIDYYD